MLFVLAVTCVALYLKREWIQKKSNNFSKLIRSFKDESRLVAFYKSTCIIIKCFFIDLYHSFTSYRTSRFLFVKHVMGGNVSIVILPIQNGPKASLEYAFIDGKRMDEIVSVLAGPHRDFSGYPESLLEFGNHIRFKFSEHEEVILERSDFDEKNKKNADHLQKIKNLVWISG
jgi:hypothetical protein